MPTSADGLEIETGCGLEKDGRMEETIELV